jgi:hypothetical protein
MILRIVADKPVRYSLNNGVSLMEYAPGEVYEVPDWAAASMIRRGWAKQVTVDDLKDEPDKAEQPEVDLSSLRKVDDKRKRKQED